MRQVLHRLLPTGAASTVANNFYKHCTAPLRPLCRCNPSAAAHPVVQPPPHTIPTQQADFQAFFLIVSGRIVSQPKGMLHFYRPSCVMREGIDPLLAPPISASSRTSPLLPQLQVPADDDDLLMMTICRAERKKERNLHSCEGTWGLRKQQNFYCPHHQLRKKMIMAVCRCLGNRAAPDARCCA